MSILLYLISVVILFTGSILVSLYGWGLTPHSWGWIIFGGLGTIFMGAIVQVAAKQLD